MQHIFILKQNKEAHAFINQVQDIIKRLNAIVFYSSSLEESIQMIQFLDKPSRLYIGGGDGTINNLLPVLVDSEHEVVVLPMGTGNDLNRAISFTKDPIEILKASLLNSSTKVDVIQINNTYCINTACFGLDSTIATHLHDETTLPIPDKMGYIVGILKYIFRYHGYHITFSNGTQELYNNKVTLFTINNGIYYGGGFASTPKADLSDGLLDVLIVDYLPLWKVPYLFLLLLAKKLEGRKEVHYLRITEGRVISPDNTCNKDGEEYISDLYEVKVLPEKINLVFNREYTH